MQQRRRRLGGTTGLAVLAAAVLVLLLVKLTGQDPKPGTVFAFDAATGRELWHVPTPMAAPTLTPAGDRVIVHGGDDCDGDKAELAALSAASGRVLWRTSDRGGGCVGAFGAGDGVVVLR